MPSCSMCRWLLWPSGSWIVATFSQSRYSAAMANRAISSSLAAAHPPFVNPWSPMSCRTDRRRSHRKLDRLSSETSPSG